MSNPVKSPIGISRVLIPTSDFERTLAFFQRPLGLSISHQGMARSDTPFKRYAELPTPNGVVLELVEPAPGFAAVYTHPVISFSVDDLVAARERIAAAGLEILSPMTPTSELYFRGPGGTPYRLTPRDQAAPTIAPRAEGVAWILAPATQFEDVDAFIETTIGLTVQARGMAVSDPHFLRYAQCTTANGLTVEVVEPKPAHVDAFSGPAVSITVTDVAATLARLSTHGADIRSDIIKTSDGTGWFYFGVPGSTTCQISGPLGS